MKLDGGVTRAVSGIIEICSYDKNADAVYRRILDEALYVACEYYSGSDEEIELLKTSLELNTLNCHKYSFSSLAAKYKMPIAQRSFKRRKYVFISEAAKRMGLM